VRARCGRALGQIDRETLTRRPYMPDGGKRPAGQHRIGLETADSARCCWPPGTRHWAPPKAFFLLSGPELGPKTWDLCAAAREGKAQLERVCGISRGPGRCTLLLCLP